MIKFLSIDGALNNFGLAWGTAAKTIEIKGIKHIETAYIGKKNLRLQTVKRARTIFDQITDIAIEHDPDVIFAELVTGSKSSTAAWSLGVSLGIISCLLYPATFVTPQEAKKVLHKGAEKAEIIEWATTMYPNLDWHIYRNKPILKNEHCADAILIAHAAYPKYLKGNVLDW